MRTVNVRLLPDKSGKVRIHWFQMDPNGPIQTPGGTIRSSAGPIPVGGAVGRLACSGSTANMVPVNLKGVTQVTPMSDDPRAATCPECLATEAYKSAMAALNETLETTAPPAQG